MPLGVSFDQFASFVGFAYLAWSKKRLPAGTSARARRWAQAALRRGRIRMVLRGPVTGLSDGRSAGTWPAPGPSGC